ncbi:hypothetical protein IE077_001787 [Cardiosporidium cionae]|uniref:Thioredoxin domain-containing protein n=1 Tax=Cardiosporidium cionae TaxID=476202 RepID=A0ABQ7JCA3_9APIC|nr:hypothetical protein IE077_001787 [Cardiosporidium cionae]|eukprot:KAF8821630.1 hypothetical protein IE077_001787 [Cardiosporidium cionae]
MGRYYRCLMHDFPVISVLLNGISKRQSQGVSLESLSRHCQTTSASGNISSPPSLNPDFINKLAMKRPGRRVATEPPLALFEDICDDQRSEFPNTKRKCVVSLAFVPWSTFHEKIVESLKRVNKRLKLKQLPISFIRFDIEENPILTKRLSIKTAPTLQLWCDGKLLDELVGKFDEMTLESFLGQFFRKNSSDVDSAATLNYLLECDEKAHLADLSELKQHLHHADENCELGASFALYIQWKKPHRESVEDLLSNILTSHIDLLDSDLYFNKLASAVTISLFDVLPMGLHDILGRLNQFYSLQEKDLGYKMNAKIDGMSNILLGKEPQQAIDSLLFIPTNAQIDSESTQNLDMAVTSKSAAIISAILSATIVTTTNTSKRIASKNTLVGGLRRMHRIAAARLFRLERYSEAISHALKSYVLDIEKGTQVAHVCNERSYHASRALLELIFNALDTTNVDPVDIRIDFNIDNPVDESHQHPDVVTGRAELEVLTTDEDFKSVKIPFARTFRGGRPRMLRGTSGKWQWLGPQWKPKWAPKWGKWDGPEEWACKF